MLDYGALSASADVADRAGVTIPAGNLTISRA
jgi:hypothetical protein